MSNKKWAVVSGIALVLIVAFFFLNNRQTNLLIQNAAMMPTVGNGDFVIIDRSFNKSLLKKGDVVMYEIAAAPGGQSMGRLIATAGDDVAIEDGSVLVNGKSLQAKASGQQVDGPEGGQFEERTEISGEKDYAVWLSPAGSERSFASLKVPDDSYFILSDNRSVGHDSRKIGAVPSSGLRGKVIKIHSSANATRNGKEL